MLLCAKQIELFHSGNREITRYARCGSPAKALAVFDVLPVRDLVSWNALIAAYDSSCDEALACYRLMQVEGVSPDPFTYVSSLKACASAGNVAGGRMLHSEASLRGLSECSLILGNVLVDMYAKFGFLSEARKVFDCLPVRDAISWNAIISGYARNRDAQQAKDCFNRMRIQGFLPNAVTFVSMLKACSASVEEMNKAMELHAEIIQTGLLERNVVLGNTLVDMYADSGWLEKACKALDKLPVQTVVSWTALIAGYTKHEQNKEAIHCFDRLQLNGISPNSVTFVSALKACGNLGAVEKGIRTHIEIARKGLLETDAMVCNAVVDMYIKCGFLGKAQEVFDDLKVRDEILWTALIAGYVKHGLHRDAMKCFEKMRMAEAVSPNAVTYVSVLKASGNIAAADRGSEIHIKVRDIGILKSDVVVGNAVIDMYFKCMMPSMAQSVFDELQMRDVVSWTTLIMGYVEHEMAEKAITSFQQMQFEGFSPNDTTFVCILEACNILGAMTKGRSVHGQIASTGISDTNLIVSNALVHMYAQCGFLQKAQEVFNMIKDRDVVTWTALITGYSQLGDTQKVFHVFDSMTVDGIRPDFVTFLSILNACSHMGLVEMGHSYFNVAVDEYCISPALEYHTCMIDLLGRAGYLNRAVHLMRQLLAHETDFVLWNVILDACRKFGQLELARMAFEQTMLLDEPPIPFLSFEQTMQLNKHVNISTSKLQVPMMNMNEHYK